MLNRTTRSLSLTEPGRLFYERACAFAKDFNNAKLEVRSFHESVKGVLRVALRPSTASTVIVPALPALLEKYPDLSIDITLRDDRCDLVANKIDVAIIPEPIYSQKEKAGVKYKLLPWLDEKLPAYTQTVGIATDETIAKHGPKLRAVIEGRRKGVEFLYANPKESAAILAKAYNLPPDVAASAIDNILKMNPTWWNRGGLQQPLMEAMAEALGSVGALQLPVDWKAAINDSFIPPSAKTQ